MVETKKADTRDTPWPEFSNDHTTVRPHSVLSKVLPGVSGYKTDNCLHHDHEGQVC